MIVYTYIYITSFFLSISSILVKNKPFTLASLYFLFFIILIFFGLRHGTGSDWLSYDTYYSYSWEEKNNALFDAAFNIVSHVVYSTGLEFNYLVLVTILIALLPILKLSRRYKYGVLILFLYSTVYLPSLMGLMRQMIAISLCLFAAEKLLHKKNKEYFFYVIVAMFFHISAVVFFLVYFVQKINISMQRVFFVLLILVGLNYLFTEQVGYYLLHKGVFFQKVQEYFFLTDYNQTPSYYSSNLPSTMLMFAQKFLFLLIFFQYFTKFFYSERGIFYLKIYSLAVMLNVIFYFSIPILATRAATYFFIVEIILLALLCEYTKYKWLFIILIMLYVGGKYFKIILSIYSQMVPYQSIFSVHS